MILLPSRATLTYTLFPYTTLFRSTSDEMLMTFCCTYALSVDSWPLDANHIYTPARTTRAGTIAKASGFSHGRDGRSGDRSSTATSSGGETSFSGSRRDCVFMPLHPDFRCAST